jgi:hypothetical protein
MRRGGGRESTADTPLKFTRLTGRHRSPPALKYHVTPNHPGSRYQKSPLVMLPLQPAASLSAQRFPPLKIRANSRNSRQNFLIPQHLTHFPLAANFVNPPTLLNSPWLGNRPRHDEPACSHSSPATDGSPPRRPPARALVPPPRLHRHHTWRPFLASLPSLSSHPPASAQKPLNFLHQNPQKPQQNPPS